MKSDSLPLRSVTWAASVAAAGPHVTKAGKLEEFTSRFGAGVQQSRFLPRSPGVQERALPVTQPVVRPAQMVLLAPETSPSAAQPGEQQARTNERLVEGSEQTSSTTMIDTQAIADSVYRLMRRDALLDRERTGR
jgi:hypothetical protein